MSISSFPSAEKEKEREKRGRKILKKVAKDGNALDKAGAIASGNLFSAPQLSQDSGDFSPRADPLQNQKKKGSIKR